MFTEQTKHGTAPHGTDGKPKQYSTTFNFVCEI